MAAMSNWLKGVLASHIFGSGTYAKPTVIAIALCKTPPGSGDNGTLTGKELDNSGNYSRKELNPSATNWLDPITNDGTENNSAITFDVATADWGYVSGVAICDSSTYGGGNMLFYGALTTPKIIGQDDQFKFNAGNLDVRFE